MSTEIQNQPVRDLLLSELGPSVESRIAWYHHMQESQPIRYRPEYNLWEVFRYKDVQQVLANSATFSAEKSLPEALPAALTKTDPPQHRQLRSLVSKAFTPRRIEELTPRLMQIVDELLEVVIARGKMNVVTELAYPLPVRVIAAMLGLPPEDHEHFWQWSYQMLGQMMGVSNPDNTAFIQYFSDLLNERKRNPREDLMSALLAAEEDGAHLTRDQIINICQELMFAGNVTTTTLISCALYRFARHPELYQTLRTDPSLIPGAIEETLRYYFSMGSIWRTARHDIMLNGHQIKAGQYVVAWTGAANFDETYFPHSEQFDIRRSPNPHQTFGHGIHFCLGYLLARLEARIALERVVARFSAIRLDPESPLQYVGKIGASRFIQSLGILFTPAIP